MTQVRELSAEFQKMNIEDEEPEKELECHARMISFFAHKGGVSKTTNVHHLGYMLAKQFNLKVLMVDGDPQQNLTQTCCKSAKHDANWRDDVDRGTIFSAVERLHYGMKDGDYIDPANCIQLYKDRLNTQKNTGELWLLPGSLDLAKLEPQITLAHNISNPSVFPLFDDIAGAFRHLFIATCAHYDIDFCLIDMGPSIGELNKSLFWASDYFVIPCSADSYCRTTVKTMERTLPVWSQQQQFLAKVTAQVTMPLNPEPPKFLGVVFSRFAVNNRGNTVLNSQHWMDVIKQAIENELMPVLSKPSCAMVHEFAQRENYSLAEIPDFLSLMPIAQRTCSPVYDIPENGYFTETDDGKKKAMPSSEISRHMARAKVFEGKYSEFAKTIIDMINSENSVEPQ